MHFPDQIIHLESELWRIAFRSGFNSANEAYEIPIRAHTQHINTYLYDSMEPTAPHEEMEAKGKRAEENVRAAMPRLEERWKGEWLPEIKEHLAYWDSFDLRGATMPELLIHLDETLDRVRRLWAIHFLVVYPAYVAISQFDDLYRDLFGEGGAFDSYRLLQGFDNKTLETNRALWGLSRRALGELMGVSAQAVEHWESGRRPIRESTRRLFLYVINGLAATKKNFSDPLDKSTTL